MLSHPLSQSEERGRDKPDMALPPELPLAQHLNHELPLARASKQTAPCLLPSFLSPLLDSSLSPGSFAHLLPPCFSSVPSFPSSVPSSSPSVLPRFNPSSSLPFLPSSPVSFPPSLLVPSSNPSVPSLTVAPSLVSSSGSLPTSLVPSFCPSLSSSSSSPSLHPSLVFSSNPPSLSPSLASSHPSVRSSHSLPPPSLFPSFSDSIHSSPVSLPSSVSVSSSNIPSSIPSFTVSSSNHHSLSPPSFSVPSLCPSSDPSLVSSFLPSFSPCSLPSCPVSLLLSSAVTSSNPPSMFPSILPSSFVSLPPSKTLPSPSGSSLASSPNVLVSSPSPAPLSPQMSPQLCPPSSPQMSPCSSPQMSPPSPPSSFPQMFPGPCVLCSSVFPRFLSSLLSMHQKEMRRLIGGAMATIDQRLSALERRLNKDRGEVRGGEDRGGRYRGGKETGRFSSSEGEEPVAGPSQSGKRRQRREEKETRRKRRKQGNEEEASGKDQSQESVCAVAGQNGLLLSSQVSSVSHDALGLYPVSHDAFGHFSDSAPCSARRRGDLRAVMSSLGHASVRLPWHLSVVAVETVLRFTAEVCVSPDRVLQDFTAAPHISSDHSYVRMSAQSLVISQRQQQKHRTNHSARRRPLPLPPVPTNGLTASMATGQSATGTDLPGNTRDVKVKRVSQIRIRRASPKETPLTPMGLPKAKRLRKKEFSLEEIYTNKNYKAPSANSSLETIFEEPREKDGALLLIGQQRRRRVLQFPDFTQPRKRKRSPTGVGLVTMAPRKRAVARRSCHGVDDCDLDVMLSQRLSALQDFLQRLGLDQDSS